MATDRKEYMRQYRAANPGKWKLTAEDRERRNARRRERYATDAQYRERIRSEMRGRKRDSLTRRAKQYGVDVHDLELALDQGCETCGASADVDPTTRLHVDHDHRTGEFRGVLCQPCNLALGHIQDDPAIAIAPFEYLMKGARREA